MRPENRSCPSGTWPPVRCPDTALFVRFLQLVVDHGDIAHIVLAVTVHLDDIFVSVPDRVFVSGLQRTSVSHVEQLGYHGILHLLHDPVGGIRGRIVNDKDIRHLGQPQTFHLRQHVSNVLPFIIGRYDNQKLFLHIISPAFAPCRTLSQKLQQFLQFLLLGHVFPFCCFSQLFSLLLIPKQRFDYCPRFPPASAGRRCRPRPPQSAPGCRCSRRR